MAMTSDRVMLVETRYCMADDKDRADRSRRAIRIALADLAPGNGRACFDGTKELSHRPKEPSHSPKELSHGTKEPSHGPKELSHGTKEPSHGTKEPSRGTKEPSDR
jgi:hypothetical protein